MANTDPSRVKLTDRPNVFVSPNVGKIVCVIVGGEPVYEKAV